MKDTRDYRHAAAELLSQVRRDLAADMEARGLGAVIWDNATAGFHFVPEVTLRTADGATTRVARITGIRCAGGSPWLIEEARAGADMGRYYDRYNEMRPTVVTLTADVAGRELGDPSEGRGYTRQGSLEEWLAVADCYFGALAGN